MARLPYPDGEGAAPASGVPNLFRMLDTNPEASQRFQRYGVLLRHKGQLPAHLRELALLQVGYSAGCDYEWLHHLAVVQDLLSLDDGGLDELVGQIKNDGKGLGELEAMVCTVAREMTDSFRMSDASFDWLKTALGSDLVFELILLVSTYNMVVRIIRSLDVDLEPKYEDLSGRYSIRIS